MGWAMAGTGQRQGSGGAASCVEKISVADRVSHCATVYTSPKQRSTQQLS